MKVLLVNKFHYLRGGAETYYFALAEGLKAAGNEVIFFSMKDDKNVPCGQSDYFVEGVEYNQKHSFIETIKISIKLIYSFEAKKKFEKLILDEKPDIIHLSNVHRQITFSIIDVANKYNIPVVYTMHDLICACPNCVMLSPTGICEECLSGNYVNCIKKGCIKHSKMKSLLASIEAYFYKWKKIYNKVDLYITPSEFYREKLIKSNFTTKPIIHMTNFLPLTTEFKMTENRDNYFLFFGRLSIEKGIMTLVKSFVLMPEAAILKIAGDGQQFEEIQSFVTDNNLENKIQLLGFQERKKMDVLIKKAKCVIIPSEWYENGPYTVMETCAKGVPVIASNIGGLTEMVIDGCNGYLFNEGSCDDLLKKMLLVMEMNSSDYENICNSTLKYAKQYFNGNDYINKLVEIYKEYVENHISGFTDNTI